MEFSLFQVILFWCFVRSQTNFYEGVLSDLKDSLLKPGKN